MKETQKYIDKIRKPIGKNEFVPSNIRRNEEKDEGKGSEKEKIRKNTRRSKTEKGKMVRRQLSWLDGVGGSPMDRQSPVSGLVDIRRLVPSETRVKWQRPSRYLLKTHAHPRQRSREVCTNTQETRRSRRSPSQSPQSQFQPDLLGLLPFCTAFPVPST